MIFLLSDTYTLEVPLNGNGWSKMQANEWDWRKCSALGSKCRKNGAAIIKGSLISKGFIFCLRFQYFRTLSTDVSSIFGDFHIFGSFAGRNCILHPILSSCTANSVNVLTNAFANKRFECNWNGIRRFKCVCTIIIYYFIYNFVNSTVSARNICQPFEALTMF